MHASWFSLNIATQMQASAMNTVNQTWSAPGGQCKEKDRPTIEYCMIRTYTFSMLNDLDMHFQHNISISAMYWSTLSLQQMKHKFMCTRHTVISRVSIIMQIESIAMLLPTICRQKSLNLKVVRYVGDHRIFKFWSTKITATLSNATWNTIYHSNVVSI